VTVHITRVNEQIFSDRQILPLFEDDITNGHSWIGGGRPLIGRCTADGICSDKGIVTLTWSRLAVGCSLDSSVQSSTFPFLDRTGSETVEKGPIDEMALEIEMTTIGGKTQKIPFVEVLAKSIVHILHHGPPKEKMLWLKYLKESGVLMK
jgi:hypothetical protein